MGLEGHRVGIMAVFVMLPLALVASPAFAHDPGEPLRDPVTGEVIIDFHTFCPSEKFYVSSSGPDEQAFGAKDNCVDGKESADDLDGGPGEDFLFGGPDEAADTLAGGSGNDHVFGEDGDDVLNGGAGNDLVRGGSGDDLVSGSGGSDWLVDGPGTDSLTGGSGADRFLVCRGEDFSQITDFQKSEGDARRHTDTGC